MTIDTEYTSVTVAACADCKTEIRGSVVRCFDCAAKSATEWGNRQRLIRARKLEKQKLRDGLGKRKGSHA